MRYAQVLKVMRIHRQSGICSLSGLFVCSLRRLACACSVQVGLGLLGESSLPTLEALARPQREWLQVYRRAVYERSRRRHEAMMKNDKAKGRFPPFLSMW